MNRHLIILVLILLFSFIQRGLSGQNISKTIIEDQYYIEGEEYTIINVEIYNNLDENILLWLEKDSVVQKENIQSKVKNYFLKQKGDTSLMNIINDYGSTIDRVSIEIFYTFYKMIPPQKAFYIILISKKSNEKQTVLEWVNKRIVLTTQSELEAVHINFLDITNLFMMSYKGMMIVIPI